MKLPALGIRTEKQRSKSAFALLLAWMLIFTPSMVRAQNNAQAEKPVATSPSNPAQKPVNSGPLGSGEKSKGAGGPREGIQVHGHWTIVVRNEDGSIASHHEFENGYVPGAVLANVLSRTYSLGLWGITLGSPCLDGGGNATGCTIAEPANTSLVGSSVFNNLVVTAQPSGTNGAYTLTLSGSVTALLSGSVTFVRSSVGLCQITTTPAAPCNNVASSALTQTTLSSPIVFSKGQIVQASVTISFSNGM